MLLLLALKQAAVQRDVINFAGKNNGLFREISLLPGLARLLHYILFQ